MKTTYNNTKIFDNRAFEELFKNYFKPLVSFALKYIKDVDYSKEVVHDVFVNLWNKRDTIDMNKSIKSYLFTSVHNRCLNYIRDNKKFNNNIIEFEGIEDGYNSEITDKMIEVEMEQKIMEVIEALPEKCREIFKLNRFEQAKYAEIAQKLDVSIKTVEAQMSKALKTLREKLSDFM